MLSRFNLFLFIGVLTCWTNQNTQAIIFRSPAEWAVQVVRDPPTDLPSHLVGAEPGFDLDENEMLKFHVWPMGLIPYYIDDLSFDKALKDTIRLYFNNVNKVTGLRFTEIPRPPEDEKSRWVFFINRKGQLGCADLSFDSFTNEGVQRVVLGYDCLAAGKMGAVVLSLIGVPPQHNAPNRAHYATIVKENILPDKLYLFDILKDDEWLFFDIPYDYYSVGHYGSHQYTSNGGETIKFKQHILKEAGNFTESSGIGFTWQDIKKIHMLYNYIIRQRDTSINVPGCDKLFAPGSNFSNFQPNISVKVKPRQKPSRYLLLENDHKYDYSDENINHGNQSKTEQQFSFESNEDNMNLTSSRQLNEINDNVGETSRDKNIKLLSHKLTNKEKILKESDYETGDEGSKKYLYEKNK